jgi:hypothetical protein
MTPTYIRCLGAAFLIAISWSSAAQAVPIELQFAGTVSADNSFDAGDTVTVDVFANNGGTSLVSQTWYTFDITSETIQVGSYSASVSGFDPTNFGDFSTDSSGKLNFLDFITYLNGTDNSDTLSTFELALTGENPIWRAVDADNNTIYTISVDDPPEITNTAISLVASTPLPAALPLLAGGLGMIGFLARKRRKTSLHDD